MYIFPKFLLNLPPKMIPICMQLGLYVELRLDRWMKILEKPLKRVYNGNDEFYVFRLERNFRIAVCW